MDLAKNKITEFFENLEKFLSEYISPISNTIDHDDNLLKVAYQQLAELGSLRLLIPVNCGGLGGERQEWIEHNVKMAKASGALLFLQAQHQFAISQLKKLLPHTNVKETLQYLVESNQGVGVSLAANRQLLQVKSVHNGFFISGELPWVTGFGYFSEILLSFDLNGMSYYALLPFQTIAQQKGSVTISPRIETAVFNATHIVGIALQHWFVSEKEIIAAQPISSRKPVEHPSIYNFAGAAKALLEIATRGKYYSHTHVKKAYEDLYAEWQKYYDQIIEGEGQSCPLELRAKGLTLAEQCANFARMVCGSRGLLASHPLTRISREIWQYAIAGYSQDQLEAYLEKIK